MERGIKMGKIKAGFGGLIGNAGEHYVMAELLKRGKLAALAPGNAPAFDILATNSDKTVRIRVKTKSEEYDIWQWSTSKDKPIFRDIHDVDDFTVLVNLALDIKNVRYYILPTNILNGWLWRDFNEWLNTPGAKGQQRSADNPKKNLNEKKSGIELKDYENNWDILWS